MKEDVGMSKPKKHANKVFFLLVKRAFFYAPRPLIDRAPRNDATSLTTYTTHTRASGHKHINIYTLNPVESNYRDGPTGHKKTFSMKM